MALDENDLKQIGELISKATEKFSPPNPDNKSKDKQDPPDPKDKSTVEIAAEKAEADRKRAAELQDTEFATKFEIGFEAFKKDNKEFLPEQLDYILSTVEAAKLENKVQKVKETKSAIMEVFFKQEKNLNILNETQKAKAKAFIDLTRDAKRESANQYWEVLEIAIDNLRNEAKYEAARKSSGIVENSGNDKYAESIFARSTQLNIPARNTVANK